jgi:hypothetical protein
LPRHSSFVSFPWVASNSSPFQKSPKGAPCAPGGTGGTTADSFQLFSVFKTVVVHSELAGETYIFSDLSLVTFYARWAAFARC